MTPDAILRKPRWVALAVLALCVGTLFQPLPSAEVPADTGPRLVLQNGASAAALPSSSLVEAVEGGESTTPTPTHRRGASTTRGHVGPPATLRGPSSPAVHRHRSGTALLGLDAAPANAPPRA